MMSIVCIALIVFLTQAVEGSTAMALAVAIFWTCMPCLFFLLGLDPETSISSQNKTRNKQETQHSLKKYALGIRIALVVFALFLLFSSTVPIYLDLVDLLIQQKAESRICVVRRDEPLAGIFGLVVRSIFTGNGQVEKLDYYFSPRKRIVINRSYSLEILRRSRIIVRCQDFSIRHIFLTGAFVAVWRTS